MANRQVIALTEYFTPYRGAMRSCVCFTIYDGAIVIPSKKLGAGPGCKSNGNNWRKSTNILCEWQGRIINCDRIHAAPIYLDLCDRITGEGYK